VKHVSYTDHLLRCSCEDGNEPSGFINDREFLVADWLLTSQGTGYSRELVRYLFRYNVLSLRRW